MVLFLLASLPDQSPLRRLLLAVGFRPTTPKRNVLLAIGYLLASLLAAQALLGIL